MLRHGILAKDRAEMAGNAGNPEVTTRIALVPSSPLSVNYRKLVRNHPCMGCLGSHYREAFRAAATCVTRAP